MEINVNKNDFIKGLNAVSKAVPSKTTMSILECILLDASKGYIRLVANDTELGIQTIISGEIVEKGIVALDAKNIVDIFRKASGDIVNIKVDDTYKTTITYDKGTICIVGKDAETFTDIPFMKREEVMEVTQFTLKELIRQTIFSVGNNDTNKILGGELFQIKDGYFKVMSLDGQRVSIRKVEIEDKTIDKKVIIPGKSLNELIKIMEGDTTKYVSIFFMPNHVIFEFEDTTVVTRLIEGEYFNIDNILSTDYETKVKINKKDFADCLDRSTLMVREGDKRPVILNFTNDSMNLKINSVIGSMSENIDIEKEGADIMIGFNPKFLIDALRVIDQETVDLYFVNPKAPCFIRDKQDSYTYLVLPINFTNVN
ncbi:MAG: DNA polymerase III subunit beta [Lachnospiraceae bacterium]|nr:DNA polymerase III subunit beta [Lachnospiraceae bacterium]